MIKQNAIKSSLWLVASLALISFLAKPVIAQPVGADGYTTFAATTDTVKI